VGTRGSAGRSSADVLLPRDTERAGTREGSGAVKPFDGEGRTRLRSGAGFKHRLRVAADAWRVPILMGISSSR
jgi:hypothetical protein